jgi:hypothetical protein
MFIETVEGKIYETDKVEWEGGLFVFIEKNKESKGHIRLLPYLLFQITDIYPH